MANTTIYPSLTILGSTGSVGEQAIDVALQNKIRVNALCANRNAAQVEQQARQLRVSACAMADEEAAKELGILQEFTPLTRARIETEAKYAGYLDKEEQAIARARKLEEKEIPVDFNFEISGLRLEARQKLAMIKPRNLGQASRISGVSPADVAVLMVALAKEERK